MLNDNLGQYPPTEEKIKALEEKLKEESSKEKLESPGLITALVDCTKLVGVVTLVGVANALIVGTIMGGLTSGIDYLTQPKQPQSKQSKTTNYHSLEETSILISGQLDGAKYIYEQRNDKKEKWKSSTLILKGIPLTIKEETVTERIFYDWDNDNKVDLFTGMPPSLRNRDALAYRTADKIFNEWKNKLADKIQKAQKEWKEKYSK